MAFAPGEQPRPQPGDLVECLARGDGAIGDEPSISRTITGAPGATLFVVSTAPAWAGNLPEEPRRRSKGAVVAFLGRVPVRVHGAAPVNSFLVPSGRSDGTARAVTHAELQEGACGASLRAQCFGVVWAQLPPDAEGRAVVLAFVSASPIPAAVSTAAGDHGAGGGWGGCGGCGGCGGGSGFAGSSGAACGGSGSAVGAGGHGQSCRSGSFGELRGVGELALLDTSLVPVVRAGKALRPYQQASVDRAIGENTIVNLPTGTGKTLIAIKVLDHFRRRHPEKKVLFIVPQVSLVRQQSKKVREDGAGAPRVAELCGATLDGWTAKSWRACVAQSDVLLGTPATFYNALFSQGLLSLSQFSLVVFDECHEATGDAPMAKLMREVYWPRVADGFDGVEEGVPHVLGLTASIVNGKLDKMEQKRQDLETLLQSSVFSPDTDAPASPGSPGDGGGSVPSRDVTYHRVEFVRGTMDRHKELVEARVASLAGLFSEIGPVEYTKATQHAQHVLVECGMSGFIFYMSEALVYQLERRATILDASQLPPSCAAKAKHLKKSLPKVREACKEAAARLASDGELTAVPNVSGKCRKLLEELVRLFTEHDDPEYKGIVFVEQVALAPPLAEVINQHMAERGCAVRAAAVSGVSSMSDAKRQARLDRFHGGALRLLVCTQALEQGTDVPSCGFVVRYSKFDTTKSHVQASGRARARDAQIFYFENDPPHEEAQAAKLSACARDESLRLSREEQQGRVDVPECGDFYPYRPAGAGAGTGTGTTTDGGGATVSLRNCVEVFHTYCGKVLRQGLDVGKLYDREQRTMGGGGGGSGSACSSPQAQARSVLVRVRYPTPDGYKTVSLAEVDAHWGDRTPEMVAGPQPAGKKAADVEKRRFLYSVVVRMSMEGYLDANNGPSPKALAATGVAAEAPALPEQLTLNDTFAPEAGQDTDASSPADGARAPSTPDSSNQPDTPAVAAALAASSPMEAAVLSALAESAAPPDALQLAKVVTAALGKQVKPSEVNSALYALERRGAIEQGPDKHGAKPTWVVSCSATTPQTTQPGRVVSAGHGAGQVGTQHHQAAPQPSFETLLAASPSAVVPMNAAGPSGGPPSPPPPPARWLKSPGSAPPSQQASPAAIQDASGYESDDAGTGNSTRHQPSVPPKSPAVKAKVVKMFNYKGMLNEWCHINGAVAEYSAEEIGPRHANQPRWVARVVLRSSDFLAEHASPATPGKKNDAEIAAAKAACEGLGIA